jgi:PIN domain nuclease of toxin-antitoxin system
LRLLLDTCAFLWLVAEPDKVPSRVVELFRSPDTEVFLSAASAWEISVKQTIGKLPLPSEAAVFVPEQRAAHRIAALEISEDDALHQARLPWLHRDPFDRLLVSQAIVRGLTIATPDPLVRQYGCRTIW